MNNVPARSNILVPIYLIISIFILPPLVGLWVLGNFDLADVYAVNSNDIYFAYLAHVVLVYAISFTTFFSCKASFRIGPTRNKYFFRANRNIYVKCLLWSVIYFVVVIFLFDGWNVFLGELNRGEFRIALGYAGFAFTWVTQYALPSILAIVTVIYLNTTPGKMDKLLFRYIALVVLATLGMMGTKSAAIRVFMPSFLIFMIYRKAFFKRLLLFLLIGFFLAVFSSVYFEDRTFEEAFIYVIYRITAVSGYGVVAAWQSFPDGSDITVFLDSLIFLLGGLFTSIVTGIPKDSVEFLKFEPARLVTYFTYPDSDAAVTGTVNLTITSFGDGVYFFGHNFFWIYSIFSGLFLGLISFLVARSVSQKNYISLTLSVVYLVYPLCAWLNSGGLTSIIGLPVVFGFFVLWIFLNVFLGPGKSYRDSSDSP